MKWRISIQASNQTAFIFRLNRIKFSRKPWGKLCTDVAHSTNHEQVILSSVDGEESQEKPFVSTKQNSVNLLSTANITYQSSSLLD